MTEMTLDFVRPQKMQFHGLNDQDMCIQSEKEDNLCTSSTTFNVLQFNKERKETIGRQQKCQENSSLGTVQNFLLGGGTFWEKYL